MCRVVLLPERKYSIEAGVPWGGMPQKMMLSLKEWDFHHILVFGTFENCINGMNTFLRKMHKPRSIPYTWGMILRQWQLTFDDFS